MEHAQLLDLKVLEKLRESGDPSLTFLRVLLDLTSQQQQQRQWTQSKYEELVFHCATGFRHVALYRWESFTAEFQSVSRDFFLCLGLGLGCGSNSLDSCFPRTLLMSSLHTSVAFWKKSWPDLVGARDKALSDEAQLAETKDVERAVIHGMRTHPLVPLHAFTTTTTLFETLEGLLLAAWNQINAGDPLNPNAQHAIRLATQSVSFLIDLVAEFSGSSLRGSSSSNQTNYHSTLEEHRLAHGAFQSIGLGRVLHIAMNSLEKLVVSFNTKTHSSFIPLAQQVTTLTCELLSWDFGHGDAGRWGSTQFTAENSATTTSLLRPPEEWRDCLVRPDFLGGIFHFYNILRPSFSHQTLSHGLGHDIRQLILLLSSFTGTIFVDSHQRLAYSQFLLDGILHILSTLVQDCQCQPPTSSQTLGLSSMIQPLEGEIVDVSVILIKLVVNLKVQGLSQLPSFEHFLNAIVTISSILLSADVDECNHCQGDIQAMQGFGWRSEALGNCLEACSLLCEDFWLLGNLGLSSEQDKSSSHHPDRSDDVNRAHLLLSSILSPLYKTYVETRIHIAKIEEYYMTLQSLELDDDQEDIYAQMLDEEIKAAATSIGRINVSSSSQVLFSRMQECFPRVIQVFSSAASSNISPEASALLEEARLLILCACHLLTDEWGNGETPLIPTAFVTVSDSSTMETVMNITFSIRSLMESQVSYLVVHPNSNHLSPFMAKHMIGYFYRWAPAYICSENPLCYRIMNSDTSKSTIEFLLTYCCHCMCYWSLETHVQESIYLLLISLAKRGATTRRLVMSSQGFVLLSILHCISSSLSHNCTEESFDQTLHASSSITPSMTHVFPSLMTFLKGYHRMAYIHRARVTTFLVVTLGQSESGSTSITLHNVLDAIQRPLIEVINSINSRNMQAEHHYTRELVHLLVELYDGVAKASDLTHCETVVLFITQSLHSLASLMTWYAQDALLCEAILRFFRDYAENFISILNQEQSLELFRSSATLLKSYSVQTCSTRTVHRHPIKSSRSHNYDDEEEEEERTYHDVLCTLQILLHLSSKDFIDTCGSSDTVEVIDFVFYGLEQIVPLVTRGLLHYPNLSYQYFSLVGFIMDVYAEKLYYLSLDLVQSLLESLLFGMSHEDSRIAKSSLGGLTGFARELIQNESFRSRLCEEKSALMDSWSYRLLEEVVFKPIIWDRLEAAGMALLPVVVMDLGRFVKIVHLICERLESDAKRNRLRGGFEKLLQLDIMTKFSKSGLEGRMNRLRFKKDFEVFVQEIHSFLIVK